MKLFTLSNKSESIFCKISLNNCRTWIQGIITDFSCDDDFMYIFLSSKNFYKYLNCKNKIIIKCLSNNYEKIYIGIIDKDSINKKSRFLKINIENILSFYDRRKYTRFLTNYTATLQFNNYSLCVKLSDLSFNGLSFFSKHRIKHASKILITINLTRKKTLNLYGNLINQIPYKNEFRYSLKTTPCTKDDEDKLIEAMDYLLLKQNGLIKKHNSKLIFLFLALFLATIIFLIFY